MPWFDPHRDFGHVRCFRHCRMGACAMPSQTNERAIVHVVNDDASMRGALEGLFDSVGLQTQTCAAARDFLARRFSDRPG
jgi:hypothetical protein